MRIRKQFVQIGVAGLVSLSALLAAPPAMAAWWNTVSKDQQGQIKVGMSKDEVHNLLGKPLLSQGYAVTPDTLCIYFTEQGGSKGRLYVYFDGSGKVSSSALKSS